MVGRNVGRSCNLEEANGTPLNRRVATSHVKQFYPKGTTDFDKTEGDEDDGGREEVEEIRETGEGNRDEGGDGEVVEGIPPCRSLRLMREVGTSS